MKKLGFGLFLLSMVLLYVFAWYDQNHNMALWYAWPTALLFFGGFVVSFAFGIGFMVQDFLFG